MRMFLAAAGMLMANTAHAALLNEQQAAERALDAMQQRHWTDRRAECVSLQPVPPRWTFIVREEHAGRCGGDPLSAPRLFDIVVDPRTGTTRRED